MKNRFLLFLLITLPMTGHSENDYSYAEKCAELIEQAKSPTANWSTSNQEAAMAGECIGAIKAITSLSANMTINTSNSYRSKRYSCLSGSVIEHAEKIVSSKAVTISHVTDALCYLD